MQTVKLNLIPGSVLPVVNVSQYDENRQFALQVYEGATAYSLSGKSVQIRGTKPDGNGFAYDATDGVVSVSGSTVTISTTQQMTAVGGQTMAELRITSGDTILGTLNFILMVEPSALSDDTPISETEIPVIERDFEAALEEAQEAAETATTKAGEASTSASNAASSATSAASSASTASDAATTATNAKNAAQDYAGSAQIHDQRAGQFATRAETAALNAESSADDAEVHALKSEGFADGKQNGTPVGPDSPYYNNNAKYWRDQAAQYAAGGLHFIASVAFANIPTTGMVNGDQYNITDDFVTDSRFVEGAGIPCRAGADIAWSESYGKWDLMSIGGGSTTLYDLADTLISNPQEDDVLKYDSTTQKWVNGAGGASGSGISVTATLLAASWDAQNQQTVTFTGYQASMNGVIGVPASATDAQKEAYASALVRTVAQNGNQFTFECESIPSIDLPVTIYAGGSSGGGGVPAGGTTDQVLAKNSNTDGDTKWMDVPSVAEVAAIANAGAKNHLNITLKSQTTKGVTVTVNRDKTFTLNGTVSPNTLYLELFTTEHIEYFAGMLFNGFPESGLDKAHSDMYVRAGQTKLASCKNGDALIAAGSGHGDVYFSIDAGQVLDNVVVSPMIRDARITDPTYEPHAETNPVLTQKVAGLQKTGCLNVLDLSSATSQVVEGVTFTVNPDYTITANGTATNNANLVVSLSSEKQITVSSGKLKWVGCPAGGSDTTYRMQLNIDSTWGYSDFGNGLVLNTTGTIKQIVVSVRNGYTANNIVFKPMITTDLSATYDDYQPYAMTNRELTEAVTKRKETSVSSQYTYSGVVRFINVNDTKIAYIDGFVNIPSKQTITLCAIPDDYKPLVRPINNDYILLPEGATTPVKIRVVANSNNNNLIVFNYSDEVLTDNNMSISFVYV